MNEVLKQLVLCQPPLFPLYYVLTDSLDNHSTQHLSEGRHPTANVCMSHLGTDEPPHERQREKLVSLEMFVFFLFC